MDPQVRAVEERAATKAEKQLASLRVAIDCLCDIGDMEPNEGHITAVAQRLLRAMTPLRNLEQLLVRTVEEEEFGRHIRTSDPTPGLLASEG